MQPGFELKEIQVAPLAAHTLMGQLMLDPRRRAGCTLACVQFNKGVLVIRQSVEVLRSRFQEAKLEMDYWPDYADQQALARIELKEED